MKTNITTNLVKSSRPHLLNVFNYKLFNCKNKTYLSYINQLVSSEKFKTELEKNNIKINYLDSSVSSVFYNEIFLIKEDGSIIFLHKQNLLKFDFNSKNLDKSIIGLLNVNIKNQQTYELILCISVLQEKFFKTNCRQDLKYFSHEDVLSFHKKHYKTALISSNISTISYNTYYRDRDNNILKLSFLLPKRYFIIYIRIKFILNRHPKATDKDITYHLEDIFDIQTTITRVYNIRKKYFIPSRINRTKDIYFQYEKNYSELIELNRKVLVDYKNISAVYELVSCEEYKYNYMSSKTVYIGSTNNIHRRLTEYVDNYGHTKKIRDYVLKNKMYFRFIKTETYRDLEKDIIDAFYTTCGEYPLLNTNRVLNKKAQIN